MKKITTLLLSFLCPAILMAQIPNASFDNWTNAGTYNNPDNWSCLNALTSPLSVYTCAKGSGGASGGGNSYLKLTSKTVAGMGVVPGVAVSGTLNTVNFKPESGFAFNQRPQYLTGAWQYMASGADAGYISVLLTKWNSNLFKRDTIAYTLHTLSGMVMSWGNFSIPLNYVSMDNPDSAIIALSASGNTPVNGSYLYVDKLLFTGTVTGLMQQKIPSDIVKIHNTIINGNLSLSIQTINTQNAVIEVYNQNAQLVNTESVNLIPGNNAVSIPLNELETGIYFVSIKNLPLPFTGKIIKD